MPLPSKALRYGQLVFKSAGETVPTSGHEVFKVEFIDAAGEVKKGFYEPISSTYPAILAQYAVASSVFMGMLTDRVAEERLVLNEEDEIMGTVSIPIPYFKPLKPEAWFFNRVKIEQQYHQVWRDSFIFLIKDILSDAKRLAREIIDELRFAPITISQTDSIKLTRTFQFLEENDLDINSIAIDCDKNNNTLLGLKDLIHFRDSLSVAAFNYYKLEKDKLTVEKNREFCRLVSTAIDNYESNIYTHFSGTHWSKKFSELMSNILNFYRHFNFQRHLSASYLPIKTKNKYDYSELLKDPHLNPENLNPETMSEAIGAWREKKTLFPEKNKLLIQSILTAETALLMQAILIDRKNFKLLVLNVSDLIILTNQFPQHTNLLLQDIDKPEEFNRLIQTPKDLKDLVKRFPEKTDLLIQYLVNNPREFKQMMTNELDILALANQSPTGAQVLIRYIVHNPNVFTRVIKNTDFFPHLGKIFPMMAEVFRQKNIKDALKAISLIKQSHTLGATMGLFSASHFSPEIPYDISKYMASFFNNKSGHHLALTCKRAYEAAKDERSKAFNELPNVLNINCP